MAELDRRTFLTRSSLAAAMAGAVAAVPGLTTLLATDAPEADATAGDAAAADASAGEAGVVDASQQLVAHVRDLSTGEIGLFNGTSEVVVHDPALARTLYAAGR